MIYQKCKTRIDQTKSEATFSRDNVPKKTSLPNLVCQIGTQLADHLEIEYDRTNIDIKGANGKLNSTSLITFEETFLKAKLWARSASDRVDAVLEALIGKFSTVRVKLIFGQQGVGDGSNPLIFATFLPLNLANGEEEEEDGCKERRQAGDGRHLEEVCGALGCSLHWSGSFYGKI